MGALAHRFDVVTDYGDNPALNCRHLVGRNRRSGCVHQAGMLYGLAERPKESSGWRCGGDALSQVKLMSVTVVPKRPRSV
jgi:hypothetical protein